MTPELVQIGSRLLEPSAGQQPASGYYGGVLYLFSIENGVMLARPCAAKSSMLSGRESYAGYPISGLAAGALASPIQTTVIPPHSTSSLSGTIVAAIALLTMGIGYVGGRLHGQSIEEEHDEERGRR